MGSKITGIFSTRRDAELAIERLVQEYAIERTDIFVAPDGTQNSAGTEVDGSDMPAALPSEQDRRDGAHGGAITVSVDTNDDDAAKNVQTAFDELAGATAVED